MAVPKSHSSAAQYLIPRSRFGKKSSKASLTENSDPPKQTRPKVMSQETKLRVPQANPEVAREDGEPRVKDFQDSYYRRTVKSSSAPAEEFPPIDGNMPTSPKFDEISSLEEDSAPPPIDFSRRGIHIPSRTSSSNQAKPQRSREPSSPTSTTPDSRERSSAESIKSYETEASSMYPLPALQTKGPPDESDLLEPVLEDDPKSFELLAPPDMAPNVFSLEHRAAQMFSRDHLQTIFADPTLLMKFTSFLSQQRQNSVSVLVYYLDALKALRAINYANAVAEALEPINGFEFTEHPARPTVNSILEDKAEQAFMSMVREDLPAYIAHTWIQLVSVSIQKRITGTLAPQLREASEGLAETFCLTDPSRPDNPIVFASEEFHRTTQYGVNYAIGRNCRFLQGPKTDPHAISRISRAVKAGKEHSEIFVNYRRDGQPFMNLLMVAPLLDSRGVIRYFIGAQVDVSGLVKECTDLEALQRLLRRQSGEEDEPPKKDEFQELSEMLNVGELDTVRKTGGRMHRESTSDTDAEASAHHQPRLLLKDPSPDMNMNGKSYISASITRANGRLGGVYEHYVLVRPYPSLRILFTSPSLRVPGILQSPFLSRIGGSARVRDELTAALASGRGVTAKVRWIARPSTHSEYDYDDAPQGRSRWIHCTPLIGHNGQVGVWMIVLVDDDKEEERKERRWRTAPPVAAVIGDNRRDMGGSRSPRANGYFESTRAMRSRPTSGSRPSTSGHALGTETPNPAASELSFRIT
ncbi:MAG: hypothetical protein M1820_004969 [Bogoriella megaspora]|nr:MAG: hypothetical protein M1820_004969 [Bogoriella megaspora]